jgi:hypothetical protein
MALRKALANRQHPGLGQMGPNPFRCGPQSLRLHVRENHARGSESYRWHSFLDILVELYRCTAQDMAIGRAIVEYSRCDRVAEASRC